VSYFGDLISNPSFVVCVVSTVFLVSPSTIYGSAYFFLGPRAAAITSTMAYTSAITRCLTDSWQEGSENLQKQVTNLPAEYSA